MADAAAGRPLLMVFLDGVGLGEADPATNPLAAATLPRLSELIGGPPVAATPPRDAAGLVYRRLDAGLGVDGLPQSATGQTSLLTGRNGAERMGRHYGPWPGPTLTAMLEEGTLFHEAAGSATLANAYPERYFRSLQRRRVRPHAPVVAARAAGVALRDLDAYRRGEGFAADITGAAFADLDPSLAAVTPIEAGRRLAALARGHAFTFVDVWPTDRFGHQGRHADAVALLEALDAMLEGLLPGLGDVTMVLTSDHGNVEDLRTSQHTHNPVPLLAVGPGAEVFEDADDLTSVGRAGRRLLAVRA